MRGAPASADEWDVRDDPLDEEDRAKAPDARLCGPGALPRAHGAEELDTTAAQQEDAPAAPEEGGGSPQPVLSEQMQTAVTCLRRLLDEAKAKMQQMELDLTEDLSLTLQTFHNAMQEMKTDLEQYAEEQIDQCMRLDLSTIEVEEKLRAFNERLQHCATERRVGAMML